ncbi:MAG TPA: hypothetical protein VLH19_00485 [Patescibacteria group bacterium]|nr:hypothetical protein [Patescibacteria group bacterium]
MNQIFTGEELVKHVAGGESVTKEQLLQFFQDSLDQQGEEGRLFNLEYSSQVKDVIDRLGKNMSEKELLDIRDFACTIALQLLRPVRR